MTACGCGVLPGSVCVVSSCGGGCAVASATLQWLFQQSAHGLIAPSVSAEERAVLLEMLLRSCQVCVCAQGCVLVHLE